MRIAALAFCLAAAPAVGQIAAITAVSPASAAQGTSGQLVTFTLDSAAPPAGAPVDSVTIGGISGTSVTHTTQDTVTALFDISISESTGAKDATITFLPPPPITDPAVFLSVGGFTVTAGADTPPTITSDPQSRTVAPGTRVVFTVAASGSIPMSYQWQKNEVDLGSPTTEPSYTIESAALGDQGEFRCIVSNDFGSATSAAATLTVDPTIAVPNVAYVVTDTNQTTAYDDSGNVITPVEGEAYYGQDSHYDGVQPSYLDNGDGTVTDLNTGLMWQQTPPSSGYGWEEAADYCESLELGDYDDWRLPTLKELFAIGDFSAGWPYLDTTYFHIAGTTVSKDEQFWGAEDYVGVTVEAGSDAAFGVNHGTGHIKAYPSGVGPGGGKRVRAVRGESIAVNDFTDNGDGTITDSATGLMWSQADSGEGILWVDALAYAENSELAGHGDWRLPNVKELQSIVDYSYSPTATDPAAVGPAIDPIFSCTPIINEGGYADYPYFWTSTSALFQAGGDFYYAWYVAFGMAVNGEGEDFHGAGAVRFDTKALDGPAGEDAERYYNYVRLVRDADTEVTGYPMVDTAQDECYDTDDVITPPAAGSPFHGQDAQYDGSQPSYEISGDLLTVYDDNTGLTWQRSSDSDDDGDIDATDKLTWTEAQAYPDTLNAANFGGYSDWRLPTIKEIYSLMDFRGVDPSGYEDTDTSGLIPFIDTTAFEFAYGDTDAGERIIDSQYASSNLYVDAEFLFGVNFADGRIKGYGLSLFGQDKTFFVICCRGNTEYGINDFIDNGNGTVTDQATGLMWQQADSGSGQTWENALDYAENATLSGFTNWRLPNAKELQGILDYTRSPGTTSSAAIDPVFTCTGITNEAGAADYPFYWTGTTHANWSDQSGRWGVYVAFGRAMGYMDGTWQDVHGAGAQRSDPKYDDGTDYSSGNGPQGDAVRIDNYVRLVRTVLPADDSVGDGITDVWRAEHFGGTGTTADADSAADADPDGDGCDNLCEFVAGTDPNDSQSKFLPTLSADTDSYVLSFQSSSERVYTLWRSVDMSEESWEMVAGQVDVAGSGGLDSLADAAPPVGACFYLIEVAVAE